MSERPSPIDRPRHHHIEFPAARILEHQIEAWPLGTSLGAADALVLEGGYDVPTAALGDLTEFA